MDNPGPRNIPLLDLQREHCREVTGIGDNGLAFYCGHRKSWPTSYCAFHRRINLMMVAGRPRHAGSVSTEARGNEKKKTEEVRHPGLQP